MESLKKKNIEQLKLLADSMSKMTYDQYARSLDLLSGASIGEHIRHVIEFYQILKKSINTGTVNYDDRKRDIELENNSGKAKSAITEIISWLQESHKDRRIKFLQNKSNSKIESSLKRELQYVYEHTTHHMAIIKIGIRHLDPKLPVSQNFGLADSTIDFQNK